MLCGCFLLQLQIAVLLDATFVKHIVDYKDGCRQYLLLVSLMWPHPVTRQPMGWHVCGQPWSWFPALACQLHLQQLCAMKPFAPCCRTQNRSGYRCQVWSIRSVWCTHCLSSSNEAFGKYSTLDWSKVCWRDSIYDIKAACCRMIRVAESFHPSGGFQTLQF